MKKHAVLALIISAASLLAPSANVAAGAGTTSVLKGTVSETQQQLRAAQNRALGLVAQGKISSTPFSVADVIRGSTAWYQGIRAGDIVTGQSINETPRGLNAVVTFTRDGKTYQTTLTSYGDYREFLNAGSEGSAPNLRISRGAPPPTPSAAPDSYLAAADFAGDTSTNFADSNRSVFQMNIQQDTRERAKKVFTGRDLVVLIDKSGSMGTTDCPQALSRWDWCKFQTMQLQNDVAEVLPRGFSLVLFNNHTQVTTNADAPAIANAFQTNRPDGGTDTAGALIGQLRSYWERKAQGSTKPMVIVVISDGAPNDERKLRNALVTAANQMSLADEISVVFVEVGEDDQATAYLEDLERNLNQEGAKFNIVHAVLFDRVKRMGLLRSIAYALTN